MRAIKDVGTGLESRPCRVSITFADLQSLHPPSFDFYTCVTYNLCVFVLFTCVTAQRVCTSVL